MNNIKVNDLVKIVKQPCTYNSHMEMVGLCGFVESISGDFVDFVELKKSNENASSWYGNVDIDCLELANDDESLIASKKEYDEYLDFLSEIGKKRAKQREDAKLKSIKKASNETGVSQDLVSKIFEIAKEFFKNDY